MSTFRSEIRAAVRRNMLWRLLDGKTPIVVTQCEKLGHLVREANAVATCVAAAKEVARRGDDAYAPLSSHDVVRRAACYILGHRPSWADGVLAANTVLVAVDAVDAGSCSDAISAATWAAAAALGKSIVGTESHDRLAKAAVEAAVKAAEEGNEDDRVQAGMVILAVASVLFRNMGAATARAAAE